MMENNTSMIKERRSYALLPSVLLVLAAFLLMIITSCLFLSRMLNGHIKKEAMDVLTNMRIQIESEVMAPETTLSVVARSIRTQLFSGASENDVQDYLREVTHYMSDDDRMLPMGPEGVYGVFDVFGGSYLNSAGMRIQSGRLTDTPPWYITAIEANGEIAATAPYRSAYSGDVVITYACRITDNNGDQLGIVCIDLSVDLLKSQITELAIMDNCYGSLLNERYDFLVHSKADVVGKNAMEFSDRFVDIYNGFMPDDEYYEYAGVNYEGVLTISFISRLSNGWMLFLEIPKGIYYQELYDMRLRISAMGIILAAVLIAILIRIDSQKNNANERAKIMLDSMPLGVSFLDKGFTRIDCNQELANILGLSGKEEYLNRYEEITPLYQPNGRLSKEMMQEQMGKAFMTGYERFEWWIQSLSGELIPCEATFVRAKRKNDYNMLMYLRDLRELKSAHEELREADEFAWLLLDVMPMGCSLWNRDFEIMDCNMEAVKLYSLPDKQCLKDSFFDLSPEFQPCGRPSRELVREVLMKAFTEGYNHFDWMHKTLNGANLPCEIILVRVKYKDDYIVAAYTRDMREINSTLEAMHKAEDELRMALSVAEESAKAKSEFLDNMSHELRTPMNGILGFLRIALSIEDPVAREENVHRAVKSAEELLKIIDIVLDFTEVEDNKMKINATPFNLKDIFYEILDDYALHVKAKNLDFNMHLPKELDRVLVADSNKLKQVLSSLIDNAFKFTEKGKITVRAKIKSQDDEHVDVDFYVRDTGIGMTPGQLKNLFTPFSQANSSATRGHGGTGLALALSKHLVTLLGGRIWAESEHNEGSTFYFSMRLHLPQAQDAPATERSETERVIEGDDIDVKAKAKAKAQARAAAKTAGSAFDPRQIRVLLVEDNEINQIIAEELLTGLGYTVDIAGNGQEALDMLEKNAYHVVLMDIQMPVLDGLTAAKRIREEPKYKDLPIVALTAHASPSDKEKSLNSGMNDHITKPIDPDVLNSTLARLLSGAA